MNIRYVYMCGVHFNSGVSCSHRRAKLPVEMELESTSTPDEGGIEDDLHEVEKKMEQMMKFKEHMFKDAKENIDQAQARYKHDYDRKRSAHEVLCIVRNS